MTKRITRGRGGPHYAHYPPSLAERRAEAASDWTLWEPRDALLSLLRQIDAGELDPRNLLLIWQARGGDALHVTVAAESNELVVAGMLTTAIYALQVR